MKKNIIITAGPTNERIDSVMKITNMSTGALGNVIAETFLEDKYEEIDTIYYVSTKMSYKPRLASEKVQYVTIESTQDLIEALKEIFSTKKIDVIIHSSAVGDYAGKYVIRAEELIDEIWDTIQTEEITKEMLMEIACFKTSGFWFVFHNLISFFKKIQNKNFYMYILYYILLQNATEIKLFSS